MLIAQSYALKSLSLNLLSLLQDLFPATVQYVRRSHAPQSLLFSNTTTILNTVLQIYIR